MTCPKPEVLNQWADGSLDRQQSLAVSRHAETCAACRRKAEELRAVGTWISSAGEPGRSCLSADDMAAVLEGGRVPAHVRTCPRCASEFRSLRGSERKATRRRHKPEQSPVMAWASAAAIFIAIGILIAVASQQTTPPPAPVAQNPVRPPQTEANRPPQVPVVPVAPPKAPEKTQTAKNDPLRPNPLNPRTSETPTTDPVVQQPEPSKTNPTVVNPPTPPTPTPTKSAEAPRPLAALNIRSGGLTALSDGKWVKPVRLEEGMAFRAEGRTQIEFAQARITLDGASRFSVAKNDFSLNEGGMSAEVATNSKFALVLDEQRIVPQTLNGRVMFSARYDRIVVEEGSARVKDTLLNEGVEHIVRKDRIEAQKRRTLAAAARSSEKKLWEMKLANENLLRFNIAGHIERDNQGAKFLVSDTAKNPAIFFGQASYFSTGDEPPLFVVKPNTAIRFRYYLTQPGALEFVMKNITKDENFNLPLDPVVKQWTTVTVYATDVPVNQGGKKVTCDLGDKYLGVTWFVGKPGSSSVVYIDRFEILEIDR
ncbi:MAG TPA: hypothetical protein VNM14_17830 [Planctomycetota bacterium]|nr:hypothetical protein [Planctomycetota bacterium]